MTGSRSSDSPLEYYYPGGPLQDDQIRVLNLLPCSPTGTDQRLKCEIETVRLSSHPIYSAVSYTWGALDNSACLWIDDAVMDITTNLFELLVRFRRADEKVALWVDAICINQKNKDEMTVQIPLMAEIYSSASEVLIWLGEGDHQSDAVMRYLKEVGQKFIQRGGDIKEPRDDTENQDIWEFVQNDPALEHLRVIWDRPWFTRRWVVQELAFAKRATVICGAESMAWEELGHANIAMGRLATDGSFHHRWLTEKGRPFKFDSNGPGRIDTLRRIRNEMQSRQLAGRSSSNVACVADAWGFECSMEKDRVCALLGIFNHGRDEAFKVDYAEPTETIYEKFALHCVHTGDPRDVLDILSYAGLSKRYALAEPYTLPSWVPDWRIRFDGPAHLLHGFSAGHKVGASMEVRSEPKELLIRGLLIDRVQLVVNCSSSFAPSDTSECSLLSPNHQAKWYKAIEALFAQRFRPYRFEMPQGVVGAPYALGGRAWEALFKTLILDEKDLLFDAKRDLPMLGRSGDSDEYFPFWEEGTAFRKRMLKVRNNDQPNEDAESNAIQIITHEEREYYTRASMNTEHRSFYITERGLIGLGPKEMGAGDIIGLPFGASVPYVLRPLEEDVAMLWDAGKTVDIERKALFQIPDGGRLTPLVLRAKKPKNELVGECYTHGIMRGEAWTFNSFFAEEFVLC